MVVIILNEGFDEVCVAAVKGLLTQAKIEAKTVGAESNKVTGASGLSYLCDTTLPSINKALVEAVIVPDGEYNPSATEPTDYIVRAAITNCGRVYAIRKGVVLASKLGLLSGVKVTAGVDYPEGSGVIPSEGDTVSDGAFFSTTLEIEAVKAVIQDGGKPLARDFSGYKAPDVSILTVGESAPDHADEIQRNVTKLNELFATFRIKAEVERVVCGPRLARYEVKPAQGTKISTLMRLQDDIMINLAIESVRMEAPIFGKNAVGIEIPLRNPSPVYLGEMISDHEFASAKSPTAFCLGKDVSGAPVFSDVAKLPHLLVSGATGMGKSSCINSILTSIIYKSSPEQVRFLLIDPKMVEFKSYASLPHLITPIVYEPKRAAAALSWAVEEMERRYELLSAEKVRNIDAYNELMAERGEKILPKIIIAIDELADLMLQVKGPVENLIMRIAQKSRAAGIHLIIGTQRPTSSVITGIVKANIPSRICFKVSSVVDSRVAIDSSGAERLLNRGDMLLSGGAMLHPIRVQGAFISEREIAEIVKQCNTNNGGACYDITVTKAIDRIERGCFEKEQEPEEITFTESEVISLLEATVSKVKKMTKKKQGEEAAKKESDALVKQLMGDDYEEDNDSGILSDKQFIQAVNLTVENGKVSTSLLQRKIMIGYGKAAKFIDYMEEMGIVSEADGAKPRTALISSTEWEAMLARALTKEG